MTGELPRYFGSVDYWVRRAAGTPVVTDALFDKRRKEIHRYDIADVNGPLTLTLPIVKPHGIPRATWRDVKVSDHGQWWHVHKVSLESAYGRTPFFEFYIDRFLPFISRDTPTLYPSVIALNQAIDKEIESLLLLPPAPAAPSAQVAQADSADISATITAAPAAPAASPSAPSRQVIGQACPMTQLPPYWQPRQGRFGFLSGLSILDLLFCLGPEAALWIRTAAAPLQAIHQP